MKPQRTSPINVDQRFNLYKGKFGRKGFQIWCKVSSLFFQKVFSKTFLDSAFDPIGLTKEQTKQMNQLKILQSHKFYWWRKFETRACLKKNCIKYFQFNECLLHRIEIRYFWTVGFQAPELQVKNNIGISLSLVVWERVKVSKEPHHRKLTLKKLPNSAAC